MAYKCVVELVVLGFKQDHISHPGRGGTKQLQMKQHFNTIFCPNVLVSLIFYISQKRGKGDRREIFGRCLFLLTLLEEDFTKLIRQALMEVLFAIQSLNTKEPVCCKKWPKQFLTSYWFGESGSSEGSKWYQTDHR